MKKFLFLCFLSLLGCNGMATLTRTASDTVYRPGKPLAVMVRVIPDPGIKAYALEETPPLGWFVSSINNGGQFNGGIVKWGVFTDSTPRDFNYVAIPPLNQTTDGLFNGVASFDGISSPIAGVISVPRDLMPPASPE